MRLQRSSLSRIVHACAVVAPAGGCQHVQSEDSKPAADRRSGRSASRGRCLRSAFTLVEIMVAIGILSMVLAAIYSSWTAILRASKTGLEAAASAQRARITIRVLEDSLASAQSFAANLPYYYFDAENGDSPVLSFVAHLSKSFPRSGKFGDLDVRRVTFSVEAAPDGSRQLVMRQTPLVMDADRDEKEHPVVLAKNVKGLEMQFWDTNKNPPDWVDEWVGQKTNQLPKMVMVTLKLADRPHSSQVTEEITRIINLPAMTVQPVWQMPRAAGGPGTPGAPGAPGTPGMPGNPGGMPRPGIPGNQGGTQFR
jgi:prepilin-type N-terminal cleavage/methylation domain-containing protein